MRITSMKATKQGKAVAVGITKESMRTRILSKLRTQKEGDRDRKSKTIKGKLFRTVIFKKAKIVMFYIAFDGEVKTTDMIEEARRLGKIIVVPICKKKRIIKACLFGEKARLVRGPYGIWEPMLEQCVNLKNLDLVVVPGVAFDKEGHRLGRGKGYYDRFLKKLPGKTASVGLAFDFQILPSVPATTHDVSVNKIIFA